MGGSGSGTNHSSGGGASSGGGTGGSGHGINCHQLIFDTSVSSPDPSVLAMLDVGNVCDLILLSSPPRIAVLTRPGGAVLGAIANRWEDLVGCLGQGIPFEAEILSVTSPVQVLIRPVP